jgi:hypothetical protein
VFGSLRFCQCWAPFSCARVFQQVKKRGDANHESAHWRRRLVAPKGAAIIYMYLYMCICIDISFDCHTFVVGRRCSLSLMSLTIWHGCLWFPLEGSPGAARSRQEPPGAARSHQEPPGATRSHQGTPGSRQGLPGAARGRRGPPGAARGRQEPPGATRRQRVPPRAGRCRQGSKGPARGRQGAFRACSCERCKTFLQNLSQNVFKTFSERLWLMFSTRRFNVLCRTFLVLHRTF